MPSAKHHYLSNLAAALLAGDWQSGPMYDRAVRACGKRHRWIRPLIRRLLIEHATTRDSRILYRWLAEDVGFQTAWERSFRPRSGVNRLEVAELFWVSPRMGPTRVPVSKPLPELPTVGAVAD